MAKIIRMPEVLAGAHEAVIAQWLKAEGSEVSIGDTLAEIETEKATVEYQAEEAGTLGRVLLQPGATAQVGDPIAVFVEPGDDEGAIDKALADAGVGESAPPTPAPAPASPATETPAQASADTPVEVPAAPAETVAESAAGADDANLPTDRLFISPIARKLAKERGIDPRTISGSGPGGRIVRLDVENFVPETTPAKPSTKATGGGSGAAAGAGVGVMTPGQPSTFTDTPHSSMRRAIARRLTESKSTVPHFYLTADIRADRLLALRAEVNEGLGVKVSVNDWVIKAVATALIQVPEANVIWTDGALRHFDNADISVAVATEGGLYTPVVRGANQLTLSRISETVKDLAERARSGQIRQDEIEGGSFAITNLGMFGTQEFSAILNPPQSGILAVGAASDRPVVDNGQLAVGKVMTVTLSCDHRAIDGALAAVFLEKLTKLLEHPASLLAA